VLTGFVYFIRQRSGSADVRQKLLAEIRSDGVFETEENITMQRVGELVREMRLQYFEACLPERMRCYCPMATGLARVVPPG
jgi:hypothetical protein